MKEKSILIYSIPEDYYFLDCLSQKIKDNPVNIYKDPSERKTFTYLIKTLNKYFKNVYVKVDSVESLTDEQFKNCYLFKNNKIEFQKESIKVDIVFNRSDDELNLKKTKIVDETGIKRLTASKWKIYQLIKDYQPITYNFVKPQQIVGILKDLKRRNINKVVMKPSKGCGGMNIILLNVKDLYDSKNLPKDIGLRDYIIQEFRETKNGFQDIIKSRHDIRVHVCGSKPSLIFIKIPQEKEFRSNSALGGDTSIFVDYQKINKKYRDKIEEIIQIISSRYPRNHYSIDFGIDEKGNFFVFEMNTNMGWPDFHPNVKAWSNDLCKMFLSYL